MAKTPTFTDSEASLGLVTPETMARFPAATYLLGRQASSEAGLDVSDPLTEEEPSFEERMPPIPTDRDEIRRILRAELESIRKEEVSRLPPRRKAYR